MYGIVYSDELYHHGIKGQKWGVRRYQNKDGSLTSAGKTQHMKAVRKFRQSDNSKSKLTPEHSKVNTNVSAKHNSKELSNKLIELHKREHSGSMRNDLKARSEIKNEVLKNMTNDQKKRYLDAYEKMLTTLKKRPATFDGMSYEEARKLERKIRSEQTKARKEYDNVVKEIISSVLGDDSSNNYSYNYVSSVSNANGKTTKKYKEQSVSAADQLEGIIGYWSDFNKDIKRSIKNG